MRRKSVNQLVHQGGVLRLEGKERVFKRAMSNWKLLEYQGFGVQLADPLDHFVILPYKLEDIKSKAIRAIGRHLSPWLMMQQLIQITFEFLTLPLQIEGVFRDSSKFPLSFLSQLFYFVIVNLHFLDVHLHNQCVLELTCLSFLQLCLTMLYLLLTALPAFGSFLKLTL